MSPLGRPRRKSKVATLKRILHPVSTRLSPFSEIKKNLRLEKHTTSANPCISNSSLPHTHQLSAIETGSGDSLVESDVTASTDYKNRISASPQPPTQPAPLSSPARDSTDNPSISASVLNHQGSRQNPETSAMSTSNTIFLTDNEGSDEERQRSDTDDTSLSYQTYGPPLRSHFHQLGKLRRDSSSSDESGVSTSNESLVTSTEDDESYSSADAHADGSVTDGHAGDSQQSSPAPEQGSFFGGDEVHPAFETPRSPCTSSDSDVASSSVSGGAAEPTVYSAGGDTLATQTRVRGDNSKLEDLHRSRTSSSEHGSTSVDELGQEQSSASPPAVSTIKSARPQNVSQTSFHDIPLASNPFTPDNTPSLPANISTATSPTGTSAKVAAINITIRDIREKFTNAAETHDREDAAVTTISSEAAGFRKQAASMKVDLKDKYKQKRDLESEIKDFRTGIKDLEIKADVKDQDVIPRVEARDKAKHLMNELAYQDRRQQKKLEIAREDEVRERSIADPFLRRLAKKLQLGRDKRGIVDSDSDGGEFMGSGDEHESDPEAEGGPTDEEDNGDGSETDGSAAEGDHESEQSSMEDHLDEFVDSYGKLARKDPKYVTMGEFSSISNAYTKIHGSVKPEVDIDNKATIKSKIKREIKHEIKREPGIKTEPDTTPEPDQATPSSNIKQERASIKHESSPAPSPGNTTTPTLPTLDDLSLTTLTADGLADDIKLAQYYQAKVSKTFELLNAPITSPAAATQGTQSGTPSNANRSSSSRVTSQQSRRTSHTSNTEPARPASDQLFSKPEGNNPHLDETPRTSRKRPAASPMPSDVESDDDEDEYERDWNTEVAGLKKQKLRHEYKARVRVYESD